MVISVANLDVLVAMSVFFVFWITPSVAANPTVRTGLLWLCLLVVVKHVLQMSLSPLRVRSQMFTASSHNRHCDGVTATKTFIAQLIILLRL